ncbi:hypothetical protein AB1N83_010042 [Pleurotus pulmonarius]
MSRSSSDNEREQEESSPPPEDDPLHLLPSIQVLTQLTYHTTIPAVGKRGKPKEQKSTKTKELPFRFAANMDIYVKFLNAILEKHGEGKYCFSAQKHYGIKVAVPPNRSQAKALNVDSYQDWGDLIVKLRAGKPKQIQVYVDMSDVRKSWDKEGTSRAGADDNDEESASGLSDEEVIIAHYRGVLEKKYGNDHDKSYTYIGPNETFRLTPLMMAAWARALYESIPGVTVEKYPNQDIFDTANRQVVTPSPSPIPSDLGHLATIVTGLAALTGRVTPAEAETHLTMSRSSSPPLPTPSKLRRFLKHAENKLGVPGALRYEASLEQDKYGPDILHLVPDERLVELGVPHGDVVRLKSGSQRWWNSADAKKRRRTNSTETHDDPFRSTPIRASSSVPANKKVRFEDRFHGGGGRTYSGPKIEPAGNDYEPPADYTTWYWCEAAGDWAPLPLGYIAVEDDVPPPDDIWN